MPRLTFDWIEQNNGIRTRQILNTLYPEGTAVHVTARLPHCKDPDNMRHPVPCDFIGTYVIASIMPTIVYNPATDRQDRVYPHLVEDDSGRFHRVLAHHMSIIRD